MREYVEITDLSISFGGVKITGFADGVTINYESSSHAEWRRQRNGRKRRHRKQRAK